MPHTGTIEYGDRKIETTEKKIRTLKSVLDRFRIYHILDEVMFFSPFNAADQLKEIHKVRGLKAGRDGSVSPKNRFGRSGGFKYRQLEIPISGIMDINIANMFYLDSNEAKLLNDLLYSFKYYE